MITKRLLATTVKAVLICFVLSAFSSQSKAQQDIYADSLLAYSSDFQNPKNCVNSSHTDYTYISKVLSLLNTSYLHARFPNSGQAGDVVDIIVQTTGAVLSTSLLNNIDVKLYNNAGMQVGDFTGPSVLQLELLSAGTNLYAIRIFTNLTDTFSIKEARLELDNLLGVSLLNEFRVYDFFIQKPCSPSGADILFSAGPSTTPGLMPYVSNPGNVVDSDPNNFAILNEPLQLLGLLAPAYIDVKFSKPGKSGNYVGFTIGNGTTSALDLSVLGQLKIDVYDESGTPRESKSNFNLLSLKLIQGTPNRYILGFVTQYSNYKIARARLTLNGVLGLALSVNVYNAYQQNVNTPLVVINVSGPTTFCTPGSVTLTAYDTLGTDYIWSNGAHTKSITVTQSGVYYVTVIDTINCNRRSIEIPVNVLPYLDVTIAGDTSLCPGTIGKLYTLQHYDTYTWSTGSTKDTISITNIGNYSVHVTKAPNCKGDDDVRVKDCNDHPPVIDTTVVLVHNIFTPNGDGINETLNIEGIQKYPNNEVRVFDKWGDMVFERRGYDNSNGWDGKLKGSADKGVPNGTYFYVIKLNAANPTGKTEYKGYLMIQR